MRMHFVKIVGCLIVVIIIFKIILLQVMFVIGGLEEKRLLTTNYWNIDQKNALRLYKMCICRQMSAIKTHELFHVVDGDDITYENDGEEHTLQVKSVLVERQRPSVCQIFTEKENVGSMASDRVYSL